MVYRLSVHEYDRMVSLGVLKDPRVELINGLLVKKVSKNPAHVIATKRLVQFAERIVPRGWHMSKEDPVRIPEWDEPEPDLAIVAGVPEDYGAQHPGPEDIALLVVVSETTLDRDQGEKLLAYAARGIAVYWIVNLVDRCVEVYTQPSAGGYGTRRDYGAGEEIPVFVGGVECGRIAVSDILP